MTKISVKSGEFRQPIAAAIARGIEVVLWHQLPSSGGLQEWYLVRNLEGLDKIIAKGRVASAFTAYEWIEVSGSQTVDRVWCEQISLAFEQELQNLMLLINSAKRAETEPIRLTWIGTLEDIAEYYQTHIGSEVAVGRISSVSNGEIVRGYFPDANGFPQSAPY